MQEGNLFSTILDVRRFNKSLSEDDNWELQDSTLESYLSSFSTLISLEEISVLAEKKNGQPLVALDIMGSGKALDEISNAKILAVTLANSDVNYSKSRYVFGGDIVSKETWKRIKNWLVENNHEGFDLVTCRPEGGIHTLPDEKKLFAFLLMNITDLLKDDGILLTQLPGSYSRTTSMQDVAALVDEIKSKLGVSVRYQSSEIFGLPSKISAIRIDK